MAKCILLGSGGSSIDEDVLTATPPKVIKSLTFLGAGSDEPQTGTLEINYANIAVGVTILGKTGTYTGKGNATETEVLTGYTASNSTKSGFSGTLPNQGSLNATNVGINYSKTLNAGYYSSINVKQNLNKWEAPSNSAGVISAYGGVTNGKVYDDSTRGRGILVKIQNNARLMGANWVFLSIPNIKPENIKNGVSIFGIQGTAKSPFPDSDVLIFDNGTWMNDAIHGAKIECIEFYESYPNGTRTWQQDHSEYVNYGNNVGGTGVANGRYNDGNLYTEYASYSSGEKKYPYCGDGYEEEYGYGYLDNFGRWRDENGIIYPKFEQAPGYRIFLDVPASSGVKRGQKRIDCIYKNDSIKHDPLIEKTLQGYMLDNSFNFYPCKKYYQYKFTFPYYINVPNDDPNKPFPNADYTGLRYCDIYQTARRGGFYVYMDHGSRHYVDEWDTYVHLNDKIDITKYIMLKINYYIIWNHCNAGLAASYSKYTYEMRGDLIISSKYYNENWNRISTDSKRINGYLGEANLTWTDRRTEMGNTDVQCPGYLVCNSESYSLANLGIKSDDNKYDLTFHFWGENDGGSTKVNTPFKAKLIVTGIKLIPGVQCYVNLSNLYAYEKSSKNRSSYDRDKGWSYTYEYSNKINIVNDVIYYDNYGDNSDYRDSYDKGHGPWFEGYNGKVDPFILYKNGNAYYLENVDTADKTNREVSINLSNQFIPTKVGKLYKVVEYFTYLYRQYSSYTYYGIGHRIDFYVCSGYNSLEKIEKLYIYKNGNNTIIYSNLKINVQKSGRSYTLSLDTSGSTVARGRVGKIYRAYVVKNDHGFLYSYYKKYFNDDSDIIEYSPFITKAFYGYMKCTGNGTTFEEVSSWEYPVPEDNPVAWRCYCMKGFEY